MTSGFIPHGFPRGGRGRPRVDTPTWAERIAALKHVPSLLRMVYRTQRRYTLAIVALRAFRAFVPVTLLWIGKLIIEAVETAYRGDVAIDWQRLATLVVLELGVAVIAEGLARASSLLESLLGDLFSNRISVQLMEHAARLDVAQFEDDDTYDRLERARRQTVARIGLLAQLLNTAQDLVTLISLTAALVVYVPWLMLLLALAVLPAFLGETHFAALGYSLLYGWTPERRMLDYLRYTAASDESAKEVKLFGLSPFLIGRYAQLADEFYEANKQLSKKRALVSSLLGIIGALGYYGAYAFIIYLTVSGATSPAGPFTIGVLTFLAGSFRQSRDLIQRFLLTLSSIYEESLYLRDLFTFFEIQPRVISKPDAIPFPHPIRDGFVFENVSFKYPGSETWAVRNLSFTLGPGESLALVGENGAGKTTLVKLLSRLYDPDEGRILLDGHDLRDYDLLGLWANVGVIFQDFIRYEFLMRENIGVGRIEHMTEEAQIREAARRSLADSVAKRLPQGFDQQLGRRFEGGVELSGGEWQKVALARAYMRDAQVLILDEPTAALDARAEYEVFQRFTELTKGKIAVLISHRFSTVRMARHILVLTGGTIAEYGTHDELLRRRGLYAELFNLQAAGYR